MDNVDRLHIYELAENVRRMLCNMPDHSDVDDAQLALNELERRAADYDARLARAGSFVPCGDGTSRCQACSFGIQGGIVSAKVTLPPE